MQFTRDYVCESVLGGSTVECIKGTEIISVTFIAPDYYKVITATPITKKQSCRLSMTRKRIEEYTNVELNK